MWRPNVSWPTVRCTVDPTPESPVVSYRGLTMYYTVGSGLASTIDSTLDSTVWALSVDCTLDATADSTLG